MQRILKGWDDFWFSSVPLLNLAIFRTVLCGTLFLMNLGKFSDLQHFYSANGLVPRSMALEMIPEFYRPPFVWFFWPDQLVSLMHGLMLVGLLLLTFGVGGRVLNIFVWILHISFIQRNYAIAFGADLIGGIFLLYLAGTQSCAKLSVVNYLKKNSVDVVSDRMTSVFFRLIQVQLCVIYAYTGMEKLKGMTWWDGTALWSVFANSQMVVFDMSWTRHFPLLIAAITFATIVFEIYFPVLVWFKNWKKIILAVGISFHSGIALIMALFSFAIIMMAPYVLFLDEEDLRKIKWVKW